MQERVFWGPASPVAIRLSSVVWAPSATKVYVMGITISNLNNFIMASCSEETWFFGSAEGADDLFIYFFLARWEVVHLWASDYLLQMRKGWKDRPSVHC